MGFGLKTDFATGRTLDLDKTYQQIIRKAVEDAGLECIRADDIVHSGVIDKPMYELLLEADVVVADLSTSNANAVYELGVRHALKPNTTIIIAEKQFKFPFDIGHIAIRPYEHLGNGIAEAEAKRARKDLAKAIKILADKNETDSPVYTFLPGLNTPVMGTSLNTVSIVKSEDPPEYHTSATSNTANEAKNTALIQELFEEAQKEGNWDLAHELLNQLLTKRPGEVYLNSVLSDLFRAARKREDWQEVIRILSKLLERVPGEVYYIQQLALATYKGKKPTLEDALAKAKQILMELNPYQTTDPETLGLWGAIHKRLWEINNQAEDLEESIWAYEKGFILKNDFYNGINFAYLLNARAAGSGKEEAKADAIWAARVREKVIRICESILQNKPLTRVPVEYIENEEQRFWVKATLIEAFIGTGQTQKANTLKAEALKSAPEPWMESTLNDQLAKLEGFLKKIKQ